MSLDQEQERETVANRSKWPDGLVEWFEDRRHTCIADDLAQIESGPADCVLAHWECISQDALDVTRLRAGEDIGLDLAEYYQEIEHEPYTEDETPGPGGVT